MARGFVAVAPNSVGATSLQGQFVIGEVADEQWTDRAALAEHFAVPQSGEFVVTLLRLANSAPEISVYDAEPVDS